MSICSNHRSTAAATAVQLVEVLNLYVKRSKEKGLVTNLNQKDTWDGASFPSRTMLFLYFRVLCSDHQPLTVLTFLTWMCSCSLRLSALYLVPYAAIFNELFTLCSKSAAHSKLQMCSRWNKRKLVLSTIFISLPFVSLCVIRFLCSYLAVSFLLRLLLSVHLYVHQQDICLPLFPAHCTNFGILYQDTHNVGLFTYLKAHSECFFFFFLH